jgi:hypothetical protein
MTNPQAANSYSYAEDNPITKKDPTGRGLELLMVPYVGIPLAILSTLATYEVLRNATNGGRLIETVQPPNFAELGFPRFSSDPGDFLPPRGGGPGWQKWIYAGLGAGALGKEIYDNYQGIQSGIKNFLGLSSQANSTKLPINSSNGGYSYSQQYVVQGNTTYRRTSGGGLAPTSLPSTVKDGQGNTFYRNSSGLLSTKPGQ